MYKYKKTVCFKVGAARRATGTKLTFVYFQKNLFFKAGAARRATGTKLTFVYFQKIRFFNSGCFSTFWPLGPRLFFWFLTSDCFKILGPRLYLDFWPALFRLFFCPAVFVPSL